MRALRSAAVVVAAALGGSDPAAAGILDALFGPRDFDGCVDRYVKPARNEAAARGLTAACRIRFLDEPPKEPAESEIQARIARESSGPRSELDDLMVRLGYANSVYGLAREQILADWRASVDRWRAERPANLARAQCFFDGLPSTETNAAAGIVMARCNQAVARGAR